MVFDVITVGAAVADIIMHAAKGKDGQIRLADGRMSFPLGAKFEIGERDYLLNSGGGATNTAVTFARQGLLTGCVAEVGEDVFGALIVEQLRHEHVQPLISVNKKLPTGASCILVHENGERTVFTMRGASGDLTLGEIPFATMETQWAYVNPGNMPESRVSRIVSVFEKRKARVALNPSKRQLERGIAGMRGVLASVDVLLVNEEEASKLTGIPKERETEIFKSLDRAVRGIVVMTMGPRGVKVSDGKTVWSAGIFKNKTIKDRLGAGDAFGAGFVAGLLAHGKENGSRGFSDGAISYAIRLASANATAVVEGLGPKVNILTQKQFASGKRWKTLPIKKNTIA